MTSKKEMYDIGKTRPDCLYDFALLLEQCQDAGVDRTSELWQMFRMVYDTAWGLLPLVIIHDFRPDLETADKATGDLYALCGCPVKNP